MGWESGMERRYNIVLEKDEDGVFIATAPAIPGVVEHGETADEAFENMARAMKFTLDSMVEEGEELPAPDAAEIRAIELAI